MTEPAIKKLIEMLEDTGVPYMVAGSFASTFHGAIRTTRDLDVVIDPSPEQLAELLYAMTSQGFYVSEGVAKNAFTARTQFNAIDIETAWKIDLILKKDRAFSDMEFSRRTTGEIQGLPASMTTLEDTILSKLDWARSSSSELQLRDVVEVLKAGGEKIDFPYLSKWASALGVTDLLGRCVKESRGR